MGSVGDPICTRFLSAHLVQEFSQGGDAKTGLEEADSLGEGVEVTLPLGKGDSCAAGSEGSESGNKGSESHRSKVERGLSGGGGGAGESSVKGECIV